MGQGTHGVIKKCYRRSDNKIFVAKVLEVMEEHFSWIRQAFKYMAPLRHPNLIRYYVYYLDEKRCICHGIMDYISHPNLSQFIFPKEKDV